MTIKEFVLNQKNQSINEWLELIKKLNMTKHETIIIDCADYFNKIIINHDANFINSINN